jgi:DNA-binding MarR family transcriptional regulator
MHYHNSKYNVMQIEKEIHQTAPFISEFHKMAVNILFTASWLDRIHSKNLKPFGLTPQQFNILRILRGQHPKPAGINMLIERMIDKSSNASRLVDRLAGKGLVYKQINEADKRAVDVVITDAGLDVLSKIDADRMVLEKWLHAITEDEAKEINRILDKLRS